MFKNLLNSKICDCWNPKEVGEYICPECKKGLEYRIKMPRKYGDYNTSDNYFRNWHKICLLIKVEKAKQMIQVEKQCTKASGWTRGGF